MLFLVQLRHNLGLLGAVAWVVALVCALVIVVAGYLSSQSTVGLRTALEERSGADIAFRPALDLADNAERQDEQVRAAITGTFAPAGGTASVTRTLDSHVTLLTDPDGEFALNAGALAMSVPDFADRADVVDGTLAASATEVTVLAAAAEQLGIAPGDDVLLAGERFTVSGTWAPKDHLDPRWYGDPIIVSGLDGDYGPFVIDESAWSRLDANPTVRWTIVPEVSQLDAARLASLTAAWFDIRDSWRSQVDDIRTLEIQGRFVQTARELSVWITGVSAIEPVVVLVLLAIALVALWELARTSAASRRDHTALIWSRGASAFGLARSAALETGVAAVVGAVLGAGVAIIVLAASLGQDAPQQVAAIARVWPALAVLLLAASGFAAVHAYRSAARDRRPDRNGRAERTRRVAGIGSVALVLAAAVLSVWQLRLYGSPLTPRIDGPESADPIAVVAPALALAAGALIAVVAFAAFAGALDRASRSAPTVPFLAARALRSRSGIAAAQVVVIALAAGTAVLAASYSATWSQSFAQTSALHAGADVHVSSRIQGIDPGTIDRVSRGGELPVAPLEIQPLTLGNESGSLVGVAPQALDDLALDAGGAFDAAAAAEAIRAPLAGAKLPSTAGALTLEADVEGVSDAMTVGATIVDGYGVLRRVPLPPAEQAVDDGGTRTYRAELPPALLAAPGPWLILSLEFGFPNGSVVNEANVEVIAVHADAEAETEVAIDGYWIPDSPDAIMDAPVTDGSQQGFTVAAGADLVRLTASFDGASTDRYQPRVVVSQRLADLVGLEVGQNVAFGLQDGVERLSASVAMIVPVIPTAPSDLAVMMDLGVIQHFQLRVSAMPAAPRDLWVSTDDVPATVAAMTPDLPANVRIDSAQDATGRSVLGAPAVALWAGAVLCIVMATTAVTATARAQARSRRPDSGVLRALGLRSREQAAVRFRELAIVILAAAIAGAVIGLAVSALTVPQLARAAIPAPYLALGTSLALDAAPLAAAILTLLAALAVVALVARWRTGAHARRALPTEGPW